MLKRFAAAFVALSINSVSAHADAVAEFYKGKTVQFVLGYGPGGGYDVYARTVARYLGKYIPGNPAVVVNNMPGAGSLRATNFLYATAPKDGLTIGAFARDMPLMGILGGNSNVQFDPRKFTWLGSASSSANDAYLLFVRKDSAVKKIDDARLPNGAEIVLAGTAEGATGNDVAVLLRDTLGLNLKVITGYPGGGAIFLAVERKEVDGRFVGLSAVSSSKPEWLGPNGPMNVLLQFARQTRHSAYPNAPTARELATNDMTRSLLDLAEMPYTLSRPVAAPPGLPADRAKALQDAFMAVQKDEEYLKETERLGLDISPIGPTETLALIDRLANAPAESKDYIKKLHTPEK